MKFADSSEITIVHKFCIITMLLSTVFAVGMGILVEYSKLTGRI